MFNDIVLIPNEQLEKLNTKRLLNVYKKVRKELDRVGTSGSPYSNMSKEEKLTYVSTLKEYKAVLKNMLALREHVE